MRWQLSMRASTSSANISRRCAAGSDGGARAGRRRFVVLMPERCRRIWFLRRSQREACCACAAAAPGEPAGGSRSELVEDAVLLAERLAKKARRELSSYRDKQDDATSVYWVTDHPLRRTGAKPFQKTIQTYGNEPTLDVVYWKIWILARVGPAGQRATMVAQA